MMKPAFGSAIPRRMLAEPHCAARQAHTAASQHAHPAAVCSLVSMMQGKTDPEAKRKCIGAGFIEVFKDFAADLKAKVQPALCAGAS